MTKLDGTAKGGVVISIKEELGVPVRWIGVGEGMDDCVHLMRKNLLMHYLIKE